MVRPFSSNGLAKAGEHYGHEPVILLRIDWPTGTAYYGDKDLVLGTLTFSGRIMNLGQFSGQLRGEGLGSFSGLSISLSDDDGSVKEALDNGSIEYVPITVYQHFQGLDQADLSQLFKGRLAGPIEWSEGSRTLKFEVQTRLRSHEVGFSVDAIEPVDPQNMFAPMNKSVPFLNNDCVDKAWPICFGNCVFVPALLFQTAPTGYLKYPFKGPRDASQPIDPSPYKDDTHLYLQDGDGANFPQGQPIELLVDGFVFRGTLVNDTFTVDTPNVPKFVNVAFGMRDASDPDSTVASVAWLNSPISIVNNWCFYQDEFGKQSYFRCIRQEGTKVQFDKAVTTGGGSFRLLGPGDTIREVAKHGRTGWADTAVFFAGSNARFLQAVDVLSRATWNIAAGSSVKLWKDTSHGTSAKRDVWVANYVSSTIIAVYAEHTNNRGVKDLLPIPSSFYTVQHGGIGITNLDGEHTPVATYIIFDPPLDSYDDGRRWSRQLYTVQKSSLGTNTSSQIKWLFDTWSDLPTDAGSFSDVASLVTKYPSSFALFDKQEVVSLCQSIAWQARCGLVIDDGSVSIRYLSTQPDSVMTFTEDNVDLASLALAFTSTDDIFTRFTSKFKLTYYSAKRYEREHVYSENVANYGLKKRSFDFFIYNIPSLVVKSTAFWGHRMANSWRLARMKTDLASEVLEVFDAPTLAFDDVSLLNIDSMLTTVNKFNVDFDNDVNDVELWMPSLAGTKVVDPKAWMDDSADATPYDPTQRYLATPNDIRWGDEESKFRVISKIIGEGGGVTPAIVVGPFVPDLSNIDDPANPANGQGNADTVDGSGVYLANLYANGFTQPPTALNVACTLVDPTNVPSADARVMVGTSDNRNYIITASGGTSVSPAKIVFVTDSTNYQVDIYADGFDKPATATAIKVKTVDLASVAFNVGDQVSVMKVGSNWVIVTTKPYADIVDELIFSARVVSHVGSGVYTVRKVLYPGAIGFAPGSVNISATEFTRSEFVSPTTDIPVLAINGGFYFFYPLGQN